MRTASRMFADLPLHDMATKISTDRGLSNSICLVKFASGPKSFVCDVSATASVSAIEGQPASEKSVAMWEAMASDPPLPNRMNRRPLIRSFAAPRIDRTPVSRLIGAKVVVAASWCHEGRGGHAL